MAGLLVTLWVILVVPVSWADIGVRKSGPYNILVEQINRCDDEGAAEIIIGTKITRTSDGKYVYSNNVYTKHPFNQNTKVNVELQSFSNGGYRPRYMHHAFKGCDDFWKYFKDTWERARESAGAVAETCPIPGANYTIKDVDINGIQINGIPVMIYNKYRVVITFYYKGVKVGCIQANIEVVPK